MSEARTELPFLNPELKPRFPKEQLGTFLFISHLELPPALAEKVPEGFVLKQYENMEYVAEKLFRDDLPPDCQSVGDLSPLEKAKILKRRQEFIKKFYGDLVIQSQYIIGDDAGVYEIQRDMGEYKTLNDFSFDDLARLDTVQRTRLKSDLEKFLDQTYKIMDQTEDKTFEGRIPDFHIRNVAITADGRLRLFDTNYFGSKESEYSCDKLKITLDKAGLLLAEL